MRQLIAGNWKMNGTKESLAQIRSIAGATPPQCDLMICPPATLIALAREEANGSHLLIGGQSCHCQKNGAHTGDLSAEMLADVGAKAVIIGHSERRQDHQETDGMANRSTKAAWRAGMSAIICVGETEKERDRGEAVSTVVSQIENSCPTSDAEGDLGQIMAIAYEPVWAIGTGKTANNEDILEMHLAIRKKLHEMFGSSADNVRILYGGSVNEGNAEDILALANVGGALVGGASLTAESFLAIASHCRPG